MNEIQLMREAYAPVAATTNKEAELEKVKKKVSKVEGMEAQAKNALKGCGPDEKERKAELEEALYKCDLIHRLLQAEIQEIHERYSGSPRKKSQPKAQPEECKKCSDGELIEMVRNLSDDHVRTINASTETDVELIAEGMLDYVNVMPHKWEQHYNPGELTGEEVYALRTAGYRRNEPSEAKKSTAANPAPAKPEMVRDVENTYISGNPMMSVYKDRLNSDQRFDDYMKNQTLKGQDRLKDVLDRARDKSNMDLGMIQRQRQEVESQRREQIKKLQALALPQAAAEVISGMGR
jgi:hypothetical protein